MSIIQSNDEIITTTAFISDLHCDDNSLLDTLSKSIQNISKIHRATALIIPGDLSDSIDNRNKVFDIVEKEFPQNYHSRVAITLGNHDIRWYNSNNDINPEVLANYKTRNQRFSPNLYSGTNSFDHWIDGYHYISINSDKGLKDMCELSDETLQWFEKRLSIDADINKPIFVMIHQPLNDTHWRAGLYGGFGKQDSKIKKILSNYPQVILLNGHIHNGFGVIEFIQRSFGTLLEIPSLTKTENGTRGKGFGWLMKIYKNKIIFEAWNFANSEIYEQHTLLLPSLSVLTAKLKKNIQNSSIEKIIDQAEKLMSHKYANDKPNGDSTIQGQDYYNIDKIYDKNRWQDIDELRKEMLALLPSLITT